jgi:hypothetical protein
MEQLDVAIDLFVAKKSRVAALTLASAAEEILGNRNLRGLVFQLITSGIAKVGDDITVEVPNRFGIGIAESFIHAIVVQFVSGSCEPRRERRRTIPQLRRHMLRPVWLSRLVLSAANLKKSLVWKSMNQCQRLYLWRKRFIRFL